MGITTCSVLHCNIGINASHRPRQCGCAKPKFGMHTSVDRTPPAHGEFWASTAATFAWYRTRMSRIFCINARCTKFFEYYFPLIVSFTSEILEPVFLQKDTSNGYAWYFHRYHNPRCMGRICFPQKFPLVCSTDHILYYCIEYQSVKNTSQDIQYLVPVQCMSILIARYNAMSSYDDHPSTHPSIHA